MRRRLLLFGVLVCAAAVLALVAPLAVTARATARATALEAAQVRAQEVAVLVAAADPGAVAGLLAAVPSGPGAVTVVLPDGATVGAAPGSGAEPALAAARTGRAVTVRAAPDLLVASPAQGAAGTSVVLVRLTPEDLRAGLLTTTAALVAAGGVLLLGAGVGALALARRTAAPLSRVADAAHRMADGDLSVRADGSGVPEVAAVGTALNRLAGRVQELLAAERRTSADLAHRLRTPLTALSVDLDGVADAGVRLRLREDLEAVQASVDEIIHAARRTGREGLAAECDAVAVVADRVAFWSVLAEDQGRPCAVRLAAGPLPVRLTREDLETAVDIALQNVFAHTPEGTPFEVAVAPGDDGGAVVTVTDEGPGWTAGRTPRTGTTGLGLEIAARTADASGGHLERLPAPGGGARLAMRLGGPRT